MCNNNFPPPPQSRTFSRMQSRPLLRDREFTNNIRNYETAQFRFYGLFRRGAAFAEFSERTGAHSLDLQSKSKDPYERRGLFPPRSRTFPTLSAEEIVAVEAVERLLFDYSIHNKSARVEMIEAVYFTLPAGDIPRGAVSRGIRDFSEDRNYTYDTVRKYLNYSCRDLRVFSEHVRESLFPK